MFEIFEAVIRKGGWKLDEMLGRIRTYGAQGHLTFEQAAALEALAREKATVRDATDLFAKVEELEGRIRALEGSVNPQPDPEAYPEFVAGKWYYAGDQVTFGDKRYTCIAPEGVVCVWSPAEYPAYWEEVWL